MEQELYHYGVLGMKWGIRRYQNADGSLTAEGRKKARKEYREDNKAAYLTGRHATIAARAHTIAVKKKERAEERYNKKPTEKRLDAKKLAERVEKRLAIEEDITRMRAERHVDNLISKYGKEAVKGLKYDSKGRINESVNKKGTVAALSLASALSTGMFMLGASPIMAIVIPKSKNDMAREKYAKTKRETKDRIAFEKSSNKQGVPEGYHWERTGGMKQDGTLWDGRKLVKDK